MIPVLVACVGSVEEPTGPNETQSPTLKATATTAATGATGGTGSTGDSGAPTPCGPLAWAQSFGSTGTDSADGLRRLPDGGFVVVGSFEYTMTVGAGTPAERLLTSVAGAEPNAFLAAHDADGTLRWATVGESSGTVLPADLAVGPDGSIAVAGLREGSATFGRLTLPDNTSSDGFVVVYAADGAVTWAGGPEGSSFDHATGVAIGPDGALALTGHFIDRVTFPDGSQITSTEGLGGGNDGYVAKYAPDGTFSWARHVFGVDRQEPVAVAVSSDAVAVVGAFFGEASFSGGSPLTLAPPVGSSGQQFVAEWGSDGVLNWARSDGGTSGSESPETISVSSAGWTTAGHTTDGIFGADETGETQFSAPQMWSLFTASYSRAGLLDHAVELHGSDYRTSIGPKDGVLNAAGDRVAMGGGVAGEAVVLGEGTPREATLTPGLYGVDAFVAAWDAAGAFLCTWDVVNGTEAAWVEGVAFDEQGGLWVAGTFEGTITLAPGTPEETMLTSVGEDDVFLARFLLEAP